MGKSGTHILLRSEALCALRRKGITKAGLAAAAELLREFSHAVGANVAGLCCVPLDGELSLEPTSNVYGFHLMKILCKSLFAKMTLVVSNMVCM